MKKLVIWGTGKTAMDFVKKIDMTKNAIIAFVDNNEAKWGATNAGIGIISPNELKLIEYDLLIICSQFKNEIMAQCIQMNIHNYITSNDESLLSLFNEQAYILACIKAVQVNSKKVIENNWRNVFVDTVGGYSWYNVPSISLGRWAVGYCYAYVLARVLESMKPKAILEMGLGQSSKIINAYAQYYTDIHYDIVEQDKNWIEFFCIENDSAKMNIWHRPISEKMVYDYNVEYAYEDFETIVEGKKYNLISIDGPYGSTELSRADIIDYIPEVLAEDFVILLDDYERIGEKRTVAIIENKLREANIEFASACYKSEKDMYIIASAKWKFLTTL